ncbi:MAG TPA: hypothetical protein VEZ46_09160, partial [Mycobacteriales bacterium]|nr:hypothetical protein [Mycobacteriales bacterium]
MRADKEMTGVSVARGEGPGVRFSQPEVDITITLKSRVRKGAQPMAAPQNYLAVIKVVGIGGGGV